MRKLVVLWIKACFLLIKSQESHLFSFGSASEASPPSFLLVHRQPICRMLPQYYQAVSRRHPICIGDTQRQFFLQQHQATALQRAGNKAMWAFAGAGLSAFQSDCLSAWQPVLLRIKSSWPKSTALFRYRC
jgi:hypothetical protein